MLGVEAHTRPRVRPIGATNLAASPAVMISENFWQRRFDGDPAVLGKTIRLNGAPFTIIGITPADFTGIDHRRPQLLAPDQPFIHTRIPTAFG